MPPSWPSSSSKTSAPTFREFGALGVEEDVSPAPLVHPHDVRIEMPVAGIVDLQVVQSHHDRGFGAAALATAARAAFVGEATIGDVDTVIKRQYATEPVNT